MGDTEHTTSNTLDAVVGATERLCGLPAVATLDWCSRAAQALSVLLAPSRVCVLIARAEPSGRIASLEASGCGSCLSRSQSLDAPVCNWSSNNPESEDDGTGIELGIRSRADRLREFGFRLESLGPGESIVATASRLGGTELWRTAPIGTMWVGSDISDLLIGALRLDDATPSRFLVVETGLLGHGPAGPRRISLDNHAAMRSIMSLLARRAGLALATNEEHEIPWLTVREQQILEQLVLGRSVRSIADELGRSPHTVHDHVKSLHRKLGAKSRGELIARALGYIEPQTLSDSHDQSQPEQAVTGTISEPKLTLTSDEEPMPPQVVIRNPQVPSQNRDES